MSTTTGTTDGFSLAKATEFIGSLASIWGGVELSKAEADKMRYESQLMAMRDQLFTPEYEAQDMRENFVSAGFAMPNNLLMWVALGGLAAYALLNK